MEYLTFGPLLWRMRVAWLPRMLGARQALVLGDGDGRFTAALLRANGAVQVTAVDASEAMLAAMRSRVARQGDASRLSVTHADARVYAPPPGCDLICTHFFLDCLQDTEVRALVPACAAALRQDGMWVVSEFAIPSGLARPVARVLVHLLYGCFRVLTGLRVSTLPDYAWAMREAGLKCVAARTSLCGLLRAEVWEHTHERYGRGVRCIQPGMNGTTDTGAKPGSQQDDVVAPAYPAYGEDELLPSIPGDPIPNPEPEQPSLGVPDPGIYEGTGGTASLG